MQADPTACVLNRFYNTKIKLHCFKSALGPTVTPFTYYFLYSENDEIKHVETLRCAHFNKTKKV